MMESRLPTSPNTITTGIVQPCLVESSDNINFAGILFNFEMFIYSELRQFELVLQEHPDYKITCMIKFASEMSPGISGEWLNTI